MANKKAKGKRAKSRGILKRKLREKLTVNKLLQEFVIGEKAIIKVNPSIHAGMPHRRFQGKIGIIKGKRGRCFEVEVSKGNAKATLILHPAHMQKVSVKN
jgi:large subunit ribosomal protein L21e